MNHAISRPPPHLLKHDGRRSRARVAVLALFLVLLTVVAVTRSTAQAASLNSNALYVSPTGTAGAAGTVGAPTSLASAISRITPGGTIYARGGTYAFASPVMIDAANSGTASALKELSAYPGEAPVLDFSAMKEDPANRGLTLNGSYWRLHGLVVQKAGDNGILVGGSHNIVERVVTRFNRDTGLQIARGIAGAPRADWPSYNLVLSSESHDNRDSGGENADGFAAKLTAGPGNVFRYDVSHNNIDDGWSLYTKSETGPIGAVTIENSLSYGNGTLSDGTQAKAGDRNGFKLGGEDIAVNHVIRNNIAVNNGKHGLTYNRNPGPMTVSGNVAIDSGERNFQFDAGSSVFKNNLSCRFRTGGSTDKVVGNADASNAFWGGGNAPGCSAYQGALAWSFNPDGSLKVTFGGTTPPTSAPPTSTPPTSTPPTSAPPTTTPPTTPGTFSDDFESGNAAEWTPSGGQWAVTTEGSRVYRQSSTAGLAVALAGSAAWTDQDVQAVVKPVQFVGSGEYAGIIARAQDASNYYVLTLRDANKIEIRKVLRGSSTVLASTAFTVNTGTQYTLRLVVKGSTLVGYVNGAQKVSASDSTFAGGRVGLSTNNGSATFDNGVVTVLTAGPPTTGPPTTVPPTSGPPTSGPPTSGPPTSGPPTTTTGPPTTPPGGGGSPTASWPNPTGSVKVSSTITVTGSLDGGLKRYYGIGDGGQGESQPAMFELADGARLSHVIIGAPAGDGVHCKGTCTLTDVWWEDVGEDAATFEGTSASQVMTVDGGGARSATDKVFQHNGPGTFVIRNFQVANFGKLYRSCGNCKTSYQRNVVVDNVVATAPGKAIVGINTNFGDTAKISRLTIVGDASRKITVCSKYKGVGKGSEPTEISSGPDGKNCLYTAADVTYR